jgi:hypothetical protein
MSTSWSSFIVLSNVSEAISSRPRIASKENDPNEGVALSDGHVALDRVLRVQPTVLHHLI